MEQQQLQPLGYPPLSSVPAQALVLFREEILSCVCLAPSAPRETRVPFVVLLAEERSFHISYFSPGGPLLASGYGPRVVIFVVVGCLGMRIPLLLYVDLLVPSSPGL